MSTYLFIFCIILFFILSTIFIKDYNNSVRKKNAYTACYDILNKKLFSMYGVKGCIWNISHILIYCGICYLLDAQFSIIKHLIVFIFGIIWYISCPYYKKGKYKCNNENDIVYENTDQPRLDDIIFNSMGQLLYIFLLYFKIIN